MPKVVISYRRSDSAAMAGRICDQLKSRYGNDSVYMDIDNIPLGIDFRAHIWAALDQADVLVAIVGPKWLGARRNGRHRIMDDHDLVRTEVEAALKRSIPVVPVLVDNAVMPDLASLPDGLKSFTFRNAASVDAGVDFHQQMERLARALDDIVGREPPVPSSLQSAPKRKPRLALAVGAAIIVLCAAPLWWFKPLILRAVETQSEGKTRGIGGPYVPWPPPGRSQWVVDKATVYLEPTGDKRQFFLIEPNNELSTQGAQPNSLLFDGRKLSDEHYEGKLFVFAGRCGTREYDASGPISNNSETVTLVGKAPRIDPESCAKLDDQERTLIFNFKRIIN